MSLIRGRGERTHGLVGTYTYGGCRCDKCRDATLRAQHAYRAKKRAADPRAVGCLICDEPIIDRRGGMLHHEARHAESFNVKPKTKIGA